MTHGMCEGIWLKRVLRELRILVGKPTRMFCNNQFSKSIAKTLIHHNKTKHVEIDRHFIKEKIDEGIIHLVYTPTCLQIENILTKALSRINFKYLNTKVGSINIYNPTWGGVWKSLSYYSDF